eukprot:scaffold407_cov142-Skeletonema_menzelii.AAC.4
MYEHFVHGVDEHYCILPLQRESFCLRASSQNVTVRRPSEKAGRHTLRDEEVVDIYYHTANMSTTRCSVNQPSITPQTFKISAQLTRDFSVDT